VHRAEKKKNKCLEGEKLQKIKQPNVRETSGKKEIARRWRVKEGKAKEEGSSERLMEQSRMG